MQTVLYVIHLLIEHTGNKYRLVPRSRRRIVHEWMVPAGCYMRYCHRGGYTHITISDFPSLSRRLAAAPFSSLLPLFQAAPSTSCFSALLYFVDRHKAQGMLFSNSHILRFTPLPSVAVPQRRSPSRPHGPTWTSLTFLIPHWAPRRSTTCSSTVLQGFQRAARNQWQPRKRTLFTRACKSETTPISNDTTLWALQTA